MMYDPKCPYTLESIIFLPFMHKMNRHCPRGGQEARKEVGGCLCGQAGCSQAARGAGAGWAMRLCRCVLRFHEWRLGFVKRAGFCGAG